MVRSPIPGWSAIEWRRHLPGAQTERRGGAGPVGACLAVRTPPAALLSSRTTSTFRLGERIEDVVVAGRGVVREDQSEHIDVEASKVVDPTADAFAAQAAGASVAAVGMVFGDSAAFESERRG